MPAEIYKHHTTIYIYYMTMLIYVCIYVYLYVYIYSGINPPPGGTHKWALCFHLSQRSLPDRHLTYVHRHPCTGTCWIQHIYIYICMHMCLFENGVYPQLWLSNNTEHDEAVDFRVSHSHTNPYNEKNPMTNNKQ